MFRLCHFSDIQLISKAEWQVEYHQLLQDLIIPAVGSLLAKYCGRTDFDKKARTEYLSPVVSRETLFLGSPPVADSPAIQVWESGSVPRVYGAGELLVEGTDYFLDQDMGAIHKLCRWFLHGPKVVKAIYTGGYLTGDGLGVPGDLKLAAVMQAKILLDRREEFGISNRSLEGGSISMNILTLPTQVTMLLDQYRIIHA